MHLFSGTRAFYFTLKYKAPIPLYFDWLKAKWAADLVVLKTVCILWPWVLMGIISFLLECMAELFRWLSNGLGGASKFIPGHLLLSDSIRDKQHEAVKRFNEWLKENKKGVFANE